jgi:hypothetical protein
VVSLLFRSKKGPPESTKDRAEATPAGPETKEPILLAAPGFTTWLHEAGVSVALTTYQAGRIILLGLRPDGTLRAHERLIEQCQGLWTDGSEIWVSGKTMLWRFATLASSVGFSLASFLRLPLQLAAAGDEGL